MNNLFRPRHPSLENVRQTQHSSRSYSQLPSSETRRTNGTSPQHHEETEEEESIWDSLACLVTGVAAIFCVVGLMTILAVLYVTVRPFSRSSFRRLAAHTGAAAFLDAVALLLPATKIYVSGDSDMPSPVGTSVLVCNHLIDADWWIILMLGRCVGLRGSVKVFLRNEVLQLRPNQGKPSVASTNGNGSSQLISSTKSVSFSRSTQAGGTSFGRVPPSPQISIAARLLHALLEFPLLSGENNKDYISDRKELFELLRSFAEDNETAAPVHLLLFPEGWSLHDNGCLDRKAVLAMSNEFAKREGRPQLKHLLLPRTTGFNACLEKLRESNPVVYDVTMAYAGYNGTVPPSLPLSLPSLWRFLRVGFPREFHVRIKRYSMEEVVHDGGWLDKQWAEKDRLLSHFSRHQSFPTDSRGFYCPRVFDTRRQALESSVLALVRLLFLPFTIPFLLLLSVPFFWTGVWLLLAFRAFKFLAAALDGGPSRSASVDPNVHDGSGTGQTPGSAGCGADSRTGTPYVPSTPFVSPSVASWRNAHGGD